MLLSCSTAVFLNPDSSVSEKIEDTKKAMSHITSENYDGFEIFIPRNFTEEDIISVFEESKKYKDKAFSLHAPKNILHKPYKEIFPNLGRLIKRAGEYNIKIIVLHPPYRTSLSSLLRSIFFIFDKMVDYAYKYNVTLTIENVPYLQSPPDFYESLINRYWSNVGITLDVEYLFSTEFSLERYSDKILKYLKNVHIRDYDGQSFDDEGNRKYLRLGEGFINFSEIIDRLRKINYRGPLTVETSFKNPLEDLKYSREFLLKLIKP